MKVGVITFTDGRKRAADMLEKQCFHFQRKVAAWLKGEGYTAVEGKTICWNYRTAIDNATYMVEKQCDAVVFNFCVWAFPDFAAQAARDIDAAGIPICFLGNVNPGFPGWVAFFASAGALDEISIPFGRVLGDLGPAAKRAPAKVAGRKKRQKKGVSIVAVSTAKHEKHTVTPAEQLRQWLLYHDPDCRKRGHKAAEKLFGMRYGEFDGPSMGMYTGHIDPSQWMEQFGIHVFHRSQLTLAWLSDQVKTERVKKGLEWLKRHCRNIFWNKDRLRDGLDGHLAKQLRFYLGVKDYCRLEGLDFIGLTGQLDYTEWKNGITMDVAEAILNDTSDWEEQYKLPLICATECDSNGALTMQILNNLTGTPVLFADLRHFFSAADIRAVARGKLKRTTILEKGWLNPLTFEGEGVYDLVNSGQHAPWFSKRSDDFRENWKDVNLHPSIPMYFPCGGASVEFFADPAPVVTFARVTRKGGRYRMHYFTGSFVRFGEEVDRRLASLTTPEWPHCWAIFDCSRSELARNYSSNHIHAVFGDWTGELEAACQTLGIEPVRL